MDTFGEGFGCGYHVDFPLTFGRGHRRRRDNYLGVETVGARASGYLLGREFAVLFHANLQRPIYGVADGVQ
jgi:hypothetical protein